MTQRVHLQDESDPEPFARAQVDQSVKNSFPIAIAGEIVVGDKETADALAHICTNNRLHIIGGAVTRFAALHIDDRAEAALERTAAACVKAGVVEGVAADHATRQDWTSRACEIPPIHSVSLRQSKRYAATSSRGRATTVST